MPSAKAVADPFADHIVESQKREEGLREWA